MLDKPEHGWSRITIGYWSERCSYLDDVPMDLLNAFILTLTYNTPSFVRFDAEGWEYLIVFSINSVEIFTEETNDEYYSSPIYRHAYIPISLKKLASELLSDVRRDLEAWGLWDTDISGAESCGLARAFRESHLVILCNKLEQILHNSV